MSIGDMMMRRIFLYMAMTFDGFVAGPNNDLDWFTPPTNDEELNQDIVEIVESADTWMMGYPTGPGLVAYWKNAEKNEKTQESEMMIARAVNKLHPIVISNKEERVEPGMELLVARNDEEFVRVVEEIKKQKEGGSIYVPGGVRTGQKFARLGLIDEYILMVHPVAIGEGKRLFTSKVDLKLVSTKAYKSGVIQVRYRPC
ncbi:MAG: dihydrofolate reductase family protein [Thaumarchaeota archaeon]|nr:dihydrofolate reductase family protein [Nitrososphaerota archaeon]